MSVIQVARLLIAELLNTFYISQERPIVLTTEREQLCEMWHVLCLSASLVQSKRLLYHNVAQIQYNHTHTDVHMQARRLTVARWNPNSPSIINKSTWEHLNTLDRPRLAGVSRSLRLVVAGGCDEEMKAIVYTTTAIWTHQRKSERPLKRLLLWV